MVKILNVLYATGLYAVIVWGLYGDNLGDSGEGPRRYKRRTEFTGEELLAPGREKERGSALYGQGRASLTRSVSVAATQGTGP